MQQFNGLDMLKIDIANTFGLDKAEWMDRLVWVEMNLGNLEALVEDASEPLLMAKAVQALRDTEAGIPTGHNMFLDATASGLQIMACMTGCKTTAAQVNLIDTGERNDVYTAVMTSINAMLSDTEQVDRAAVKDPLMTHFYNSRRQPILAFGEIVESEEAYNYIMTDQDTGLFWGMTPVLQAFYDMLPELFPGACAMMLTVNPYWDANALEHIWTLPDGHVARVLVTNMVNAHIEVDELDHATFAYRFEANGPSEVGTSLLPNIVHSVDGYVVREMVRRSHALGFELAHIHDAFTAHPNNMQKVRELYVEILAEIAESNLLADILSEISGTTVELQKFSDDLHLDILNSEYPLS